MITHTVDLSSGITEDFFINLATLAGQKLMARKRLTDITVELLQNIQKHSVSLHNAALRIQQHGSGYSIHAVNVIAQEDILPLTQTIGYINSLSHTQQKKQHTILLRNTSLNNKSGAGLGLYRIAIRSASALKASFQQINPKHFIFSLHVTLTA